MIYGEVKRKLRWDGKGLAGSILIKCDWSDVDPAYALYLPQVGEAWTGLPQLQCVDVDMDEFSPGLCELTAQYSTELQLGEEFYDMSLEYGTETADITRGMTWETAGTPVTIDIPTVIPVSTLTLRSRSEAPPDEDVREAINKVNDRKFLGYDAELMRFDGCNTSRSYNINGDTISVVTTYVFSIRDRSWNEEWRPALQALDIEYNPIFWQNIDAGEDYYTTDMAKIATPVWINEIPGQSSNPAGVAGWDKPKDGDDNYRYGSCDFATVLGLTKMIGDE